MISQYDVSFRRLGWAVDYLKAFLKPQLIEELGSIVGDLTDVDELMHLRAAIDICREHEIHCLGADQQYESTQVCIDHIYQNTAMGEVYEWGGDTGEPPFLVLATSNAHKTTTRKQLCADIFIKVMPGASRLRLVLILPQA